MPPRPDVPRVQVIREHGRSARPLRSRFAGAVPSVRIRPLAQRTILVVAGFWPLLAAVGLIFFLAWAMAVGQSP